VVDTLGKTPNIEHVVSPLQPGGEGLVSKDGRSILVNFDIAGDSDKAGDKIDPIIAAMKSVAKDFKRAERLSIPITLAVLLLTFGAIVAAVLPLASRSAPRGRARQQRSRWPPPPRDGRSSSPASP
jgi:RND superfamily putative drug exporter